MKTILIVEKSLDGLRATRDRLVRELGDGGNLRKYSDDSVETHDDKVFFLKVVSLNDYRTKLTQIIGRGYDEVNIDSVREELTGLLDAMNLTIITDAKLVSDKVKKEIETSPADENTDPDPDGKLDLGNKENANLDKDK